MGLEFKDNTSLSRVYNGETKAETCTFPYPGEFLRGVENIDEPVYCKTALRRISGHFNKRSYIDENYIARSVGA